MPELVAFHRRELGLRRDFLRTLWYWKMAPVGVLILTALLVKWNKDAVFDALFALGCLVLTSFAARSQARGIQKRIDELDVRVDSLSIP